MSLFNSLIVWTQNTFLPYGPLGLFILAFIEASFFPIPPDILLIALALANPDQAFLFALIATIGTTLGGILGYYIGYLGKKTVLEKMISKEKIKKVHRLFNRYESWTIFIAGFTPIPYKVFAISGGVFYINLKKFIIATMISRGIRFFLIATLLFIFGEQIKIFLENYFDILGISAIMVLIIFIVIYKRFKKPISQ